MPARSSSSRGCREGARAGTGAWSTLASVKQQLLAWFRAQGRDLPWRHTSDPYAILVSEVMLQQYRVENVELPLLA
jgi:A/G-specific adenine glycosylase